MLKNTLENLEPNKMLGTNDDISLVLFIKSAFDEMVDNDEMLFKMIKKVRRSNNLRFVVAAGAIYYIYTTFNSRLEKLEKTQEKPEVKTE